MTNLTRFLFVLLSAVWLLACSDDTRQRARIPTLPLADDSARTRTALQALNRAIAVSAPASAFAKRAALYLAMGQPKQALADIDEALSRDANRGRYHLTRAEVLRSLNQPGNALEAAQRAEILGVVAPELYTLIGDLLQQQNQFGRAKLYIAKALQQAPYDGEAHFFSGLMAARQGDTTTAISLYNRSLQLKPRYLETYQQLAAVHRSLGDIGSALAYTERATRYFPRNASLQFSRGLIYQTAGRADSALLAYQQAVTINPVYYQPHFQMGLIYVKFKNYYRALASFQRVQQLRPQTERIDFFIGQCLEQTGQYEQAIVAYTKAATQNPTDQPAQAGLWRSQRRLEARQNPYATYLPESPVAESFEEAAASPLPDTTRIRIAPIQPRSRARSEVDTISRTVRSF